MVWAALGERRICISPEEGLVKGCRQFKREGACLVNKPVNDLPGFNRREGELREFLEGQATRTPALTRKALTRRSRLRPGEFATAKQLVMQQIASFDMTDQDKLGATPWKALPLKVEKERQTYRYCRQVPVAAFPEELPARLVPFTSANSSSSGIMELRRYLYWVDTLHSQLSERQRLVRRFPTLTPLLSRPCVAAKPPLDPPVVPPSLLSHPMGPPRAAGFQFPSTPKPSRPPDSKWLYGTAHSCVVRPDLRDVAPVEKRRVSFIG